ncbi:hypothetical protein MAFF301560_33380 [Ralstonia solanacearum]|nr:hypothetical protein MAFF301560_33380 [Ralstonia solanacearum]BEU45297.1 hypothetical protein MAFF211519_06220 [Ralstonia pseudosolanacearum]
MKAHAFERFTQPSLPDESDPGLLPSFLLPRNSDSVCTEPNQRANGACIQLGEIAAIKELARRVGHLNLKGN